MNKIINQFKVGHENLSKTKYPSERPFEKKENTIIIDFPGFGDSDSMAVDICVSVWLRKVILCAKSIKFIVLSKQASLEEGRGGGEVPGGA